MSWCLHRNTNDLNLVGTSEVAESVVERDNLARGGVYRCKSDSQLFIESCDRSKSRVTRRLDLRRALWELGRYSRCDAFNVDCRALRVQPDVWIGPAVTVLFTLFFAVFFPFFFIVLLSLEVDPRVALVDTLCKLKQILFAFASRFEQRECPLIKAESVHDDEVRASELLRIGRGWLKRVDVNTSRDDRFYRHGATKRKLRKISKYAGCCNHRVVSSSLAALARRRGSCAPVASSNQDERRKCSAHCRPYRSLDTHSHGSSFVCLGSLGGKIGSVQCAERQSGQRPKSSSRCCSILKPVRRAASRVTAAIPQSSTSVVAPQLRQTRWW